MQFSRRYLKPALAIVVLVAVGGSLVGLRASQANKDSPKKADDAPKVFEFAAGDLVELKREALGRDVPDEVAPAPQGLGRLHLLLGGDLGELAHVRAHELAVVGRLGLGVGHQFTNRLYVRSPERHPNPIGRADRA